MRVGDRAGDSIRRIVRPGDLRQTQTHAHHLLHAGYLTASPFAITPYQPEKPVDVRTLEERIERLEAKLSEQSDAAPAKRRAARATNDADAE